MTFIKLKKTLVFLNEDRLCVMSDNVTTNVQYNQMFQMYNHSKKLNNTKSAFQ